MSGIQCSDVGGRKRMNGATPAFGASLSPATRAASTERNQRNGLARSAALDTAFRLNAITETERDRVSAPIRKRLLRERAVRPFLDSIFTPSRDFYLPADDNTMVCRCEEITAGQIRRVAAEGGMGPNQVKAKIRCGMGPCQGRMCGMTVAEIIADVYRTPVSGNRAISASDLL